MIVIMIDPRNMGRTFLPIALSFILIGGLYPDLAVTENYHLDKAVEACAFALVALLCCAASVGNERVLWTVSLFILVAGLELVQGCVPGRYMRLDDLLAGWAGVVACALSWRWTEKSLGLVPQYT